MAKRETLRSVRVGYPDGTSKVRTGYPVRDGTGEGWTGDRKRGVATTGVVNADAPPRGVKVRKRPVAAKRRTQKR